VASFLVPESDNCRCVGTVLSLGGRTRRCHRVCG